MPQYKVLIKNPQHTDWLSLQEVNVVKHLPVLGSQVIEPVLNDALALLNKTTNTKQEKKGNTYILIRLYCLRYSNMTQGLASNLRGKKAELALNVLIDVVLLTGKAPHATTKLWFNVLVHAHLLRSLQ